MASSLSLLTMVVAFLTALVTGTGVQVEDVTGRQLEAALQTENLLAVMFCKYFFSS